MIIDRTASMSNADVQATRDAANAVLQIYDPAVQRVALGLLGPSGTSSTCGSPGVAVKASAAGYGTNTTTDLAKWIPIGLTGIGAPGYNEAYVNAAGVLNTSSHIVSAIACFDHPGGTGTNLATPMAMATKYLQTYGRTGVKWGIILETDGQPSYGGTGDPNNYTCAQASADATSAKNAGHRGLHHRLRPRRREQRQLPGQLGQLERPEGHVAPGQHGLGADGRHPVHRRRERATATTSTASPRPPT